MALPKRTVARLAVLMVVVAPSCAGLSQPHRPSDAAPAPSTAAQAALPKAKVYGCAAFRELKPGKPSPVTLEALRSAVDAPDPATTHALFEKLGRARVSEDPAWPRIVQYDYGEIGLRLEARRVGGQQQLKSVEFRGGLFSPGWAGPLPEDLSFLMNVQDTFSALGLPDEKRMRTYAGSPHHYRTRGLLVRFDADGCLFGVGFIARIEPGKIRFDDLIVDATHSESGLTGIHVSFTRSLGAWGNPRGPMSLALELRDEKGTPVRALGRDGSDAGPLRVEAVGSASDEIRGVIFIPFSGMQLAPGPHTLRAELSARAVDASGGDVALEIESGGTFEASFEMPRLRRARVGVRRVEVEPGAYDGSSGAPDLRWNYARTLWGVLHFFSSTTRDNTFSGSWSELTPWHVVATNDLITLCVEDDDVLDSETLGCFSFTLDEAIAIAKERRALAARRVRRLILAVPVVSPLGKR